MKLHPKSGLPDEFEEDEEKMLDSWIEGFRSGRLDPKVFLARIYGLAYGTGFLHGRKESDRLRKEYEKN